MTGLGAKLSSSGNIVLFLGMCCALDQKVENLVMLCGGRGMKGKITPPDEGGTEEDQIRLPSAPLRSDTPSPPHICALASKFLIAHLQ